MNHARFCGFGLDLSEHHLRFVEVSWLDRIKVMHEIVLPEGAVVDGYVKEAEVIQSLFREALSSHGLLTMQPRKLTFLVPQPRAGRILQLNEADIASFCSILPASLFDLVAIETSPQALLRLHQTYSRHATRPKGAQALTLVADVGHESISVTVFDRRGGVQATHTQGYEPASTREESAWEVMNDFLHQVTEAHTFPSLCLLAGVEGQNETLLAQVKAAWPHLPTHLIGESIRASERARKEMHIYGAALGAAVRSIHVRRFASQQNAISSP